jgi:hypothetical protein
MSSNTIYCLAVNRAQASNIVSRLKEAGFEDRDISVLFADKEDTKEFAKEKHTSNPETKGAEGTATGAGAGGVVGGTLGLLAGIGTLLIPGVGPFLAAGPIAATLGGAAVGATVGGLAGGLIGLGIPEIDAKHYEEKVKEGNLLIAVEAKDWEHDRRARRIFQEASATAITSSGALPEERSGRTPMKDSGVPHQPYQPSPQQRPSVPPYVPVP